MVRLVTYPYKTYSGRCDTRRTEDCLVSDWRTNKLILVPNDDSNLLMKSDNSEIGYQHTNQHQFTNSENSWSENSFKPIHRTISDYWRDVLRYHWPIVIQSLFLVTVIITLGPWVGSTCNENISGIVEDRSVTWAIPIISQFKTSLDLSDTFIPKPTCTYGFCCFSQNIEGSSTRRRASFLKRKRITKALDEF